MPPGSQIAKELYIRANDRIQAAEIWRQQVGAAPWRTGIEGIVEDIRGGDRRSRAAVTDLNETLQRLHWCCQSLNLQSIAIKCLRELASGSQAERLRRYLQILELICCPLCPKKSLLPPFQ